VVVEAHASETRDLAAASGSAYRPGFH